MFWICLPVGVRWLTGSRVKMFISYENCQFRHKEISTLLFVCTKKWYISCFLILLDQSMLFRLLSRCTGHWCRKWSPLDMPISFSVSHTQATLGCPTQVYWWLHKYILTHFDNDRVSEVQQHYLVCSKSQGTTHVYVNFPLLLIQIEQQFGCLCFANRPWLLVPNQSLSKG